MRCRDEASRALRDGGGGLRDDDGALRKAYDDNGLNGSPIRTEWIYSSPCRRGGVTALTN
jgi:hypothetical protein